MKPARKPRQIGLGLILFQSLKGILAHWNKVFPNIDKPIKMVSIPKRYSGSLKQIDAPVVTEPALFQSLKGILAHWNVIWKGPMLMGTQFQSLKGILAHWNLDIQSHSPDWEVSIPKRYSGSLKPSWYSCLGSTGDVSIPKRYSGSLKRQKIRCPRTLQHVSIPKRYSGSLKHFYTSDTRSYKVGFNP